MSGWDARKFLGGPRRCEREFEIWDLKSQKMNGLAEARFGMELEVVFGQRVGMGNA
jgi:hypothetical protein